MARRKRFFNVAINGYLILQKKKKKGFLISQKMNFFDVAKK